MRTTIELPDDLLIRAKLSATEAGLSLEEFFIEAMPSLTAEQIDEAVFS